MNKEQLGKFKVVVWNNTSGDTLSRPSHYFSA